MKKISLLSVFLAICCLLVGCSSPFSKHTVSNTEEVRSEMFLDKPDSVICITNGKEKQLSGDSLETVYNSFMNLMDSLGETSTLKTPFQSKHVNEWKKEYTCFEFRYSQRHNYVGTLSDESSMFSWGKLKFDAFLFIYYSGGLIAVPYSDKNYVGINNLFLFLTFPEEEITEFINTIEE